VTVSISDDALVIVAAVIVLLAVVGWMLRHR
jgi:hypothetical protein